jgi:hypothetical protein
MTTTHQRVLEQILSQGREQYAPEMEDDDYFEFFAAQQVLRERPLDPHEIREGIVGGDDSGSDGGIDGFYILVNGRSILDLETADDLKALKQNITLELIVLQATLHSGFELTKLVRLKDTMDDILSLDKDPAGFSEGYSESLLSIIRVFRHVHKILMPKFPVFHMQVFLVTQGDTATILGNVRGTATDLQDAACERLATIQLCHCEFVGAKELVAIASKPPKLDFPLKCVDTASSGPGAYVSLVKLKDYYEMIKGEDGQMLTSLFESNVRDYQGDVSVNEAIRDTLSKPASPPEQFWWLNNGITILAEKLGGHPKELNIRQPQIVNGLQTSEEIFKYFFAHSDLVNGDTRELLVKIIESNDVEVQDKIIRATNSQTSIPPAYLWATEDIHRNIEKIFRTSGLYYDRRKNSYRRQGQPLAKVVGISELAQAVASIYLREPNQARSSPGRYFKKGTHHKVFNNSYDIAMYAVCAHIKKKAEKFMKTEVPSKQHRNNLLYYVMMMTALLHLKTPKARPAAIADIDLAKITDQSFADALNVVFPIYKKYGENDKAAKGPDITTDLRTILQEKAKQGVRPKKKKS